MEHKLPRYLFFDDPNKTTTDYDDDCLYDDGTDTVCMTEQATIGTFALAIERIRRERNTLDRLIVFRLQWHQELLRRANGDADKRIGELVAADEIRPETDYEDDED